MANNKSLRREIEQLTIESIVSTTGGAMFGFWLDNVGVLAEPPNLLSYAAGGWLAYQAGKFIAPRWYRAWKNGQRTTAMQLPVDEYEPAIYHQGRPVNNAARNQQSTFQHTMTLISHALHTRRNYGTMGQTYNEPVVRREQSREVFKYVRPLYAIYKGIAYQFLAKELAEFLSEAITRQRAGKRPFPKRYWTIARKKRIEEVRYYAIMVWIVKNGCTVDRVANKTGRLNIDKANRVLEKLRSLERNGM